MTFYVQQEHAGPHEPDGVCRTVAHARVASPVELLAAAQLHADLVNNATREVCQRCNESRGLGFHSEKWDEVAGEQWKNSILCIRCFAELGDEKWVRWEEGLTVYFVSFRTHRELLDE